MSDFSITVVNIASGATEVLPLDPNTSIQEVIGFCQAVFGLGDGIRLFKDGKALSTSATLRSAGTFTWLPCFICDFALVHARPPHVLASVPTLTLVHLDNRSCKWRHVGSAKACRPPSRSGSSSSSKRRIGLFESLGGRTRTSRCQFGTPKTRLLSRHVIGRCHDAQSTSTGVCFAALVQGSSL